MRLIKCSAGPASSRLARRCCRPWSPHGSDHDHHTATATTTTTSSDTHHGDNDEDGPRPSTRRVAISDHVLTHTMHTRQSRERETEHEQVQRQNGKQMERLATARYQTAACRDPGGKNMAETGNSHPKLWTRPLVFGSVRSLVVKNSPPSRCS